LLHDFSITDNTESYITKEAAKELRIKLSSKGEQQDHDYDEILKKFLMNMKQTSDESMMLDEQIVYDKKYFDYLPNDLDSDDMDEDSVQELVKSISDVMSAEHETATGHKERRVNSRKFKRDLSSQSRPKRQSIYYYVPLPIAYSSNRFSSHPYTDFVFPGPMNYEPIPAASTQFQSRSSFISPPSNPWHPRNGGKFAPPGNFYLPPSVPGIK
jgi:hypothetical protein